MLFQEISHYSKINFPNHLLPRSTLVKIFHENINRNSKSFSVFFCILKNLLLINYINDKKNWFLPADSNIYQVNKYMIYQ